MISWVVIIGSTIVIGFVLWMTYPACLACYRQHCVANSHGYVDMDRF